MATHSLLNVWLDPDFSSTNHHIVLNSKLPWGRDLPFMFYRQCYFIGTKPWAVTCGLLVSHRWCAKQQVNATDSKHNMEIQHGHTSFGACGEMNSAKMVSASCANNSGGSSLYLPHIFQNWMFSSLNSDFKNSSNNSIPSAQRREITIGCLVASRNGMPPCIE